MCDCMSARNKNKFETVQGVTGLSLLLLLLRAVQYSQIIFLEKCIFPLSINADCQGTQMNFFGNFLHE